MKKIPFLLSALLITGNTYTSNFTQPATSMAYSLAKDRETDIELSESTQRPVLRTVFQPIKIAQGSNYIRISIVDQTLGNIGIAILDETGNPIYTNRINASTQSDLLIYFSSFETGIYTILLQGADDRQWEGILCLN